MQRTLLVYMAASHWQNKTAPFLYPGMLPKE
jgi:hypothetical protein